MKAWWTARSTFTQVLILIPALLVIAFVAYRLGFGLGAIATRT